MRISTSGVFSGNGLVGRGGAAVSGLGGRGGGILGQPTNVFGDSSSQRSTYFGPMYHP